MPPDKGRLGQTGVSPHEAGRGEGQTVPALGAPGVLEAQWETGSSWGSSEHHPPNSTTWCRGRRGAWTGSPDPWVLCPALGEVVVPCPMDSALLGSQEVSEPHAGPMCLPGPPAHTLLWGTPHHRPGRQVMGTRCWTGLPASPTMCGLTLQDFVFIIP